ncbi:MAG: hypothetical protein L6R38_000162 [Xanthoria sp. 2 TBL-2021]|nr:MAG: hypothetical protein L6R38_000162 [Xanthoria sp. 2 TBL-2021]
MADIKKRFHSVAFFSNLASSLCLSVLLALGVFVNVNKFIVGTDSTQGYKAINLDTVPWNVVCTVIGTAVGILAAVLYGFLYKAAYIAGGEMRNDNNPYVRYKTYLPDTGPLSDTIYA